ncbi:hypothetical protein SMGD1_1517 [Sulfurimonas gotlandica GD1]|jgi:hypothetical protein|uniref:Uncharacterized protein n=1 Tax=Sulfurimonas gotlandica (strain DSM 19862 / JCM 16533 / GD1) TaxID=929558 RepID=B6BHP2_SULGG|nr:DUF4006 family protein [Sulfurimonas gotlandica]EDZ63373.1 conserved hypothetical protein [Sulfurimonas gotlandica GD1]EHP30041.1 hypothetical protein SMGD1_1517 [Sulfurimonas gotlandica GD1]
MNENRSVFALDGITGMLIATVLLLTILVTLTVLGLGVQNANAANYYEVKNENTIKMFGSSRADHIVDVK